MSNGERICCRRGHLFSLGNTRIRIDDAGGRHRVCRACERSRMQSARHPAKKSAQRR